NHIQGPYANYYHNFLDKEEHEDKDKHGLFDYQKRPVCNIRRFEMIKYSFRQDEEYVAIKECEYDDLTITNEDACRAYQEIFRSMDEGWMVFLYGDLAGKEIDKVGEVSIIWNPMCVVSCWNPDAFTTHILAHKLNLENLPSKTSGEFLVLIFLFSRF
ncbi:hypothetical protein Tco_0291609, partial [Tanacetum coccineum]